MSSSGHTANSALYFPLRLLALQYELSCCASAAWNGVVMARLQPERPQAMTTALDRPQLQLASHFYTVTFPHAVHLPPHAARSLHTVMENLPDEVITMIIALLPARHVKRFALTCRLFAAWAELLDVVNADTVGDCSGPQLLVHGSKLSDLFQRRTIRSLVLAQSRQCQTNRHRGLSMDNTACRLFRDRPALQHLQLLALEYLPVNSHPAGLVLGVITVLNAGVLPQLRSLTLAGIVPSRNVPQLLDGAAKCPRLHYLDLKDLETDAETYSSHAAPHAAPHEHEPFAQPLLQRSLKLLDLSLHGLVPKLPGKIRSGLLDSLHNYRAMQVLDVSGALRRPTRFCAAVVKLPELRELYMASTALFTLPDETLATFWTGLAALGGERIDRMGDYHGPRGLQLLDVTGYNSCKSAPFFERRQRQMLQASAGMLSNPNRILLHCPIPVPLSHTRRPCCAQTLAPLCNLEILAPGPTGRLAPRPAGATTADFEELGPGALSSKCSGRRARASLAFATRVSLCRFIAFAASNLPDRSRVRWVRQQIFGFQFVPNRSLERLRICAGVEFEWLLFASTWFCGLSAVPKPEFDDELDSESEQGEEPSAAPGW